VVGLRPEAGIEGRAVDHIGGNCINSRLSRVKMSARVARPEANEDRAGAPVDISLDRFRATLEDYKPQPPCQLRRPAPLTRLLLIRRT